MTDKEVMQMALDAVLSIAYPQLNTVSPQREWQGLTDEERTALAWESDNGWHCVAITEAKLKEKNRY